MNKLIHNGHIIVDKLATAKHTIVGQDLERSILKATTDELALPKRKYVDYLVMCTEDQNISVSDMCNSILDRTHHSSWVVTFKALLIVHEMMNYGNERFFQYMASVNHSLNLDNFSDRTDTISLLMSKHVRSYANYINSKAVSFRVVGYDFCKVKRGGKEAFFKTLVTIKLFKNLSQLQTQLQSLLAFKPVLTDLTNRVLVQAFTVAFKDLIRIVACLNDGTANLLENFSTLNRKDCQQSLHLYNDFPNYLFHVSKYYEIAEHLSFEASQMPSINQVPANLHQRMDEHIKNLEMGPCRSASIYTLLPKPESKKDSQRRLSMPVSSFLSSSSLSSPHSSLSFHPLQSTTTTTTSSPFTNNFGDDLSVERKEQESIMAEEERILEMFRQQKEEADQKDQTAINGVTPALTTQPEDSTVKDLFSTLNLSQPPSCNSITPVPISPIQPSNHNSFSTSSPPGFTKVQDILEPTRLNPNLSPPTVASSPPTPVLLDFSKVSVPPLQFMSFNYSALAYNQMNPLAPTQISSAPLFPAPTPFSQQTSMLQQLQQEQQKQFLQHPQKNPFFY